MNARQKIVRVFNSHQRMNWAGTLWYWLRNK